MLCCCQAVVFCVVSSRIELLDVGMERKTMRGIHSTASVAAAAVVLMMTGILMSRVDGFTDRGAMATDSTPTVTSKAIQNNQLNG